MVFFFLSGEAVAYPHPPGFRHCMCSKMSKLKSLFVYLGQPEQQQREHLQQRKQQHEHEHGHHGHGSLPPLLRHHVVFIWSRNIGEHWAHRDVQGVLYQLNTVYHN